MKNPMKPDEMKQAIDDVDAGCYMQYRTIGTRQWLWREHDHGKPLNFAEEEYRRKPEQLVRYAFIVDNGTSMTGVTLQQALESKIAYNGEGTIHRLVEDTDWVEPEPAMPEKNPWRKIIPGEWPECKPGKTITMEYENGRVETRIASDFRWDLTNATHWRYAEDE